MTKFKAWDSKRKEWIGYADLIMEASGRVWAGDINNPPLILIKKEDVVLYTGLDDKNGQNVYDGSIILWQIDNGVGIEHYQGVVVWSENTTKFRNSYKWLVKYTNNTGKEEYDELSTPAHYKNSLLIIGNLQEGFH